MMQDETRTLANTVTEPAEKGFDRAALLSVGGIVAALGAATCCVLPFALFFAGISGAWIGNLTVLEPYRPIFIGTALVALFFAYRRIFRPAQACKPGEVCAVPQVVKTAQKIIFLIVAALTGGAVVFPYLLPLFY